MRAAGFITVFCGIETPEPDALRSISKDQNLRMPILEAVRVINSYGIELSAGVIFGFDTDGPDTADNVIRFIEEAQIPFVKSNILVALPMTPLWRRLEKEGRLHKDRPLDELELARFGENHGPRLRGHAPDS